VGRECGFEQPFEAMKKALDVSEAPENEGFLRADAVLAVMFLTDEDDCSALQPDVIFDPDPAQDRVGSELGCLTSFRCFEFGVSCDVDGREVGPRRDCRPMTEKQGALLFPLDRYSQFLGNLKDPGRVVVGAMAGPVSDEIVVQLGLEPEGCPELAVACERTLGAYPAVRIQALLSLFQSERDLEEWTTGMCSANPEIRALEVFGRQIVDRLGWK
jgi:hypothetical protein